MLKDFQSRFYRIYGIIVRGRHTAGHTNTPAIYV